MLYKNGKDLNYLDELVEEAETIEQLLLKVSKLLDSCQPNRPGRIRLYFGTRTVRSVIPIPYL